MLCKFTPLGFETQRLDIFNYEACCVNLPRWGLKLLETLKAKPFVTCKFTPLGFETVCDRLINSYDRSVNLPRWGLKHSDKAFIRCSPQGVNLPRWGLKQVRIFYIVF